MVDRRLLVVVHSRTGGTATLADAVIAGAGDDALAELPDRVIVERRSPFDVDAAGLLGADGIILGTPANFGYMSGALKDLFDRTYHDCLERMTGRPWALFVKGSSDAAGAVTSVERIVAGLGWRAVALPLVVVGPLTDAHRDAAYELGGTMAAGLATGLY